MINIVYIGESWFLGLWPHLWSFCSNTSSEDVKGKNTCQVNLSRRTDSILFKFNYSLLSINHKFKFVLFACKIQNECRFIICYAGNLFSFREFPTFQYYGFYQQVINESHPQWNLWIELLQLFCMRTQDIYGTKRSGYILIIQN